MIDHYMLIQSSYTDYELSRRRLNICRETCIPSLRYQTRKPTVHVAINPNDPLLDQRLSAFESTGCRIVPIWEPWKLYGMNWSLPDGVKLISRMDDDDVVTPDFCKQTWMMATRCNPESALVWPTGYLLWRGSPYKMVHRGNQFVSLLSKNHDPHQKGHWIYARSWPTFTVSQLPGWVWVRHGDSVSSTLAKYRKTKVQRIHPQLFPINWRSVERSIQESGLPSGDYKEHKRFKNAQSSV